MTTHWEGYCSPSFLPVVTDFVSLSDNRGFFILHGALQEPSFFLYWCFRNFMCTAIGVEDPIQTQKLNGVYKKTLFMLILDCWKPPDWNGVSQPETSSRTASKWASRLFFLAFTHGLKRPPNSWRRVPARHSRVVKELISCSYYARWTIRLWYRTCYP